MNSYIASAIRLRYGPVAIIFTDEKPQEAVQFKEGGRGCAIGLFATAARGNTAVVDRNTVGCGGGVVGLCFGSAWEKTPGGIEYFLSTGRGEGYPEGEYYKKTPELARDLVDRFPITDIPYKYVVFKPLLEVDSEKETPAVVVFLATPDQLSALVVLANYGVPGNENVIAPFAAACSTVCLIPYWESKREQPRGVIGITDITARPIVDPEVLSFAVPYSMFLRMEEDAPESFLSKHSWAQVLDRIP